MQINIREFSFLNDLWDRIDIIEVEERKMKKLVLTMLSIAGMMLFTALPAKACTSYYVGKDCTKDGTTMYGRRMQYIKMNQVRQNFRHRLKSIQRTVIRSAVIMREMKMDILENLVQTVKVLQCLQRRQHLLQRVSDSTIHM